MKGINFIELTCQRCGGELKEQNDAYVCIHCGKKWKMENLQGFTDMLEACGQALRGQRAEEIANLRQLLWTETHKEFISNIEVSRLCNEILKYLPQDFYAAFFLATCSKNRTTLSDFLITVEADEHYEDIPLILDYLLKALKPEWAMGVSNFIEKIKDVDVSLYNKYRTEFEAEYVKIEECIFEPTFPRDVFVAYSSKDMAKVSELVAVLEEEKLTCFVSAVNMRHGSGSVENYEKTIQTAIDHCSVILFISSDNSRSVRCDAYKELEYVNKNCSRKPRVEYVIQNYSGRATERFFEEFFLGLEYCTSAKDAAARVCDIIQHNRHRDDKQEAKKPQEPKPENQEQRHTRKKENTKKLINSGEYRLGANSCLVKYLGKDTDIIIPDTIKSIGDNAFANCTLITSISLPDSITSIGEKAFYNCCSLKEINLPESLISIGACAFHTCRSLTGIIIPKGVLTTGSGLFGNCDSLKKIYCMASSRPGGWAKSRYNDWDIACNGAKVIWNCGKKDLDTSDFEMDGEKLVSYQGFGGSVHIPYTVSTIGDNAFGGNKTVTDVTFTEGLFSIGGFAFGHCTALKSVKISSSVNSIGDYAFYGCTSLESIKVDENNKYYTDIFGNLYSGNRPDKYAFYKNRSENYAFHYNELVRYAAGKSDEKFTLSNKDVLRISNGAFSQAKSLKSVTLHKKLRYIGERAFIGCSSLESIVIPKSVNIIGGDAFKDCTSLKTIYCRAKEKPSGWNNNWSGGCGADIIWGYGRFFGLIKRIKELIKWIKKI